MGGNFKQDTESTEGIATHLIKSTFNKKELVEQKWHKTSITTEELLEDFHKYIVLKSKSEETGDQTFKLHTSHVLAADDTGDTNRDILSSDQSETSGDSKGSLQGQMSPPLFINVKESGHSPTAFTAEKT